MRRLPRSALLAGASLLLALGCSSGAKRGATRPSLIAVPVATAQPVETVAPDDPWREWRSPATQMGAFYQVVEIDAVGMGNPTAACQVHDVTGAVLVTCDRDLARVDGDQLDFSLGWKATAGEVVFRPPSGRWPEELWIFGSTDMRGPMAMAYEQDDPFRQGFGKWLHYRNGEWSVFASSSPDMRPYLGHHLLPVLPAVGSVDRAKPDCADFACARVVPRFLTDGDVKPDFSALEGKVAWIHVPPEQRGTTEGGSHSASMDFNILVSQDGPVFVVMRALEIATKRRGWGVMHWAPSTGAAFDWLPSPFDSPRRAWAGSSQLDDGRLTVRVDDSSDKQTYVLELAGRTWSKRRVAKDLRHASAAAAQRPAIRVSESTYYADGKVLMRRFPDGKTEPVPPFDEPDGEYIVQVRELAKDDIWVSTLRGLYRTVKPRERFVRSGLGRRVHPWPAPATDDCKHPFVIFDAVSETAAASTELAQARWADLPTHLPILEMRFGGQFILGVTATDMREADKLVHLWNAPQVEETPTGVVCARPVNARPYVPR